MNLEESQKDVYDLIAEFARSSNPSITKKEIEADFVSPFENSKFEYERELNVTTPVPETVVSSDKLTELNLKFELLSEQFKETQKQIHKIKQLFSLNEPIVETPPQQEYYHKEFKALSEKLNEVFVSNYKQIESKFESLQGEMLLNRTKGDSLAIDQTKIMNSFKIQFSQIQALKEKIENVKEIFIERTGTKENSITKEDLKAEFANFTNTHIQQFNEHVQRKEEEIRLANEQPSFQQSNTTSNRHSFPIWLIWLNVFILGLMSMYLLNQIFKPSQTIPTTTTVPSIENQSKEETSKIPSTNELQQEPAIESGTIAPTVLQQIDSMNQDNKLQVASNSKIARYPKNKTIHSSYKARTKKYYKSNKPAIIEPIPSPISEESQKNNSPVVEKKESTNNIPSETVKQPPVTFGED